MTVEFMRRAEKTLTRGLLPDRVRTKGASAIFYALQCLINHSRPTCGTGATGKASRGMSRRLG